MTNDNNFSPLIRLVSFSLGIGLLLLLFLAYFREITAINQDLGRHLLTGELIWKTWQVPTTNFYSYTYPDFPFINHHYLSEVLFFLVHQAGGFSGLLLFTTLLMILSCSILFLFTLKRTAFVPLLFVSLLYLPVLFERTDLRPEIFSYTFTILFIVILFSFRERFTKLIYLLPFLSLLWVNTHIYFPIGLLLIALFFADSVIVKRKNLRNKQTLTLLGIGTTAGLITLFNPNGLSGALYPLSVFHNYGYTIEENQTLFLLESLGFSKPSFFPFKLTVVLLFLSLLLTLKKTRPIDWLLSLTFTFIALSAVRNFPLFAFATFLPLARSLSLLLKKFENSLTSSQQTIATAILLGSAVVLLLVQINSISTRYPIGPRVPQGASKAVDFFKTQHLSGPIFNNFDIGSYLSYQLYPQERVFIDGRPEAYPADFIQHVYIPMQEDSRLFKDYAITYQFNTIVFSHTDQTPWAKQFIQSILIDDSWKTVYLDPMMIILVKDIPKNRTVIEKYGMDKNHLRMQNIGDDLKSLYQAAVFYQAVGLTNQEQELYQKILQKDPQNCPVLYQLALSEGQQNTLTLQRYQMYCQ